MAALSPNTPGSFHQTALPNMPPLRRLEILLCNYIFLPSVLGNPHDDNFFSSNPSLNIHSIHYIGVKTPTFRHLFVDALLHNLQRWDFHHIEITIATAVRMENDDSTVRVHMDHIISGACFDSKNNFMTLISPTGKVVPFKLDLLYGPNCTQDVSFSYRKLYTWECVIEYIRVFIKWAKGSGDVDPINPLKALGLLGHGYALRKAGEPVRGVLSFQGVSVGKTSAR